MCKKILVIIGMVLFVSFKITNLHADSLQIIPPQKPTLSSEEIIKKIQDSENPAEVLTAELVKDVALVGSISSCKDTLNRFIDAGADMPIITPNAVGKQSPLEVMQNIIDVIS